MGPIPNPLNSILQMLLPVSHMKWWTVFILFGIVLALFMIVGNASAGAGTVVVDDDNGTWRDYSTIQDALDDNAEVIYVYAGTYNETIAPIDFTEMIGNGTDETFIVGDGSVNTVSINVSRVGIHDLTISGATATDTAGIYIANTNNVSVSNVSVSDNDNGIIANSCHGLIFDNVTVTNCTRGLEYNDSEYITLYDVNVTDCDIGVQLNFTDNIWLIKVNSSDNVNSGIVMDTCSGAQVSGCQLHNNGGNALVEDSSDVTIENGRFSGHDSVLQLYGTSNSTVRTSHFWNNTGYGISISWWSRDNIVENNTIHGGRDGLVLQFDNNNTYANNTILDCSDYGIEMTQSDNDTFVGNNISGCGDGGIYLGSAKMNLIVNNSISRSTEYGIYACLNAAWNEFAYNEIFGCGDYAFYFSGVNDNLVHHNNVADNGNNTSQAYDDNNDNSWDNSSNGGNYWSDWGGGGDYKIDGWGSTDDEWPLGEPVETSAPEKVPEFGPLVVLSMVLFMAIVFRRRRR